MNKPIRLFYHIALFFLASMSVDMLASTMQYNPQTALKTIFHTNIQMFNYQMICAMTLVNRQWCAAMQAMAPFFAEWMEKNKVFECLLPVDKGALKWKKNGAAVAYLLLHNNPLTHDSDADSSDEEGTLMKTQSPEDELRHERFVVTLCRSELQKDCTNYFLPAICELPEICRGLYFFREIPHFGPIYRAVIKDDAWVTSTVTIFPVLFNYKGDSCLYVTKTIEGRDLPLVEYTILDKEIHNKKMRREKISQPAKGESGIVIDMIHIDGYGRTRDCFVTADGMSSKPFIIDHTLSNIGLLLTRPHSETNSTKTFLSREKPDNAHHTYLS
jgi:hypothetical protein